MVTTAGSASGMAATARLTAVSSITSGGSPRSQPATKMIAQIASTTSARLWPKRASRFCSGVLPDSPDSSVAIFPSSVRMPVATTRPRARPYVTTVPLYARLRRSPSGRSASASRASCFSTGCDSPVSADSSTLSAASSVRRRSAGRMLPASSSTRSPGTSSRASITPGWPSRMTRACGLAIRFSAAIARSARYSWTKPMMPLRNTMTTMAMASCGSPTMPAITAAAISTTIMKSVNCDASMTSGERRPDSCSTLAPACSSRAEAAAAESPVFRSLSRCAATASLSRQCQCGSAESVAIQVEKQRVQQIDDQQQQADPADRAQDPRSRPQYQPDHRQPAHHHGGEGGGGMGKGNIDQQRPRQVDQIVEGEDGDIEQVAAEQVADGQIDRAHAQRSHRDHDFGGGRDRGDEQRPHEALLPGHGRGQVLGEEWQQYAGRHDRNRGDNIALHRLLQAHPGMAFDAILDILADLRPLVAVQRAHGEQVQQQDDRSVEADMADGGDRAGAIQQQIETGEADQGDAVAGGQHVALPRAGVDGFLAIKKIQQHDDEQVEHAAAQDVAHGDVRHLGDGHRRQAGDQLRQRSHGGQQDEPHPAAAHPALLGDDVAVAREPDARHADHGEAGSKGKPDDCEVLHACREFASKGYGAWQIALG